VRHQLEIFGSYSKSLEDLYCEVEACKKCPYHKINDRRVNGRGAIDAPIMIVGQGPGPREIAEGKPYVGGSGRKLREILKLDEIAVPMEDVYLTNLIRCKQPEGKNIIAKAIKMCSGWLEDEVHLVSPKLIVCLGTPAMAWVMEIDKGNIADSRGRVMDSRYGIPAIGTYHTAYLIRMKRSAASEYQKVAREAYEHWQAVGRYYRNGN